MSNKVASIKFQGDASQFMSTIAKMQTALRQLGNSVGRIGQGPNGPASTGGGGGGGGSGGIAGGSSQALNMLTSIAGTLGLSFSTGALLQRARGISNSRNQIAALTGGPATNSASQLGFTDQERRERVMDIARASGKNMKGSTQAHLANISEQLERAFGISSGESAGFMGAARKAGVQDQGKYIQKAIGTAMAAGLNDSRVAEFLQTMAQGITQLSQGVNIDSESLMGFAGALQSLPFFKSDPARTMRTVMGLDQTFKGGDKFQNAMWARSIGAATGGKATPAFIELKKMFGPFGTPDPDTLKKLGKLPGGGDLVKMFHQTENVLPIGIKHASDRTKGLKTDRRILEFMTSLGQQGSPGAGLSMFVNGQSGNNFNGRAANGMNLKGRLGQTFAGEDAATAKRGAMFDRALDTMAKDVAKVANKMVEALKLDSDGLAKFGETLMAATFALTAYTTAMSIKGGLEAAGGIGGLAQMAGKGGVYGLAALAIGATAYGSYQVGKKFTRYGRAAASEEAAKKRQEEYEEKYGVDLDALTSGRTGGRKSSSSMSAAMKGDPQVLLASEALKKQDITNAHLAALVRRTGNGSGKIPSHAHTIDKDAKIGHH